VDGLPTRPRTRIVTVFDIAGRQALITDSSPTNKMPNAVTVNSVLANVARVWRGRRRRCAHFNARVGLIAGGLPTLVVGLIVLPYTRRLDRRQPTETNIGLPAVDHALPDAGAICDQVCDGPVHTGALSAGSEPSTWPCTKNVGPQRRRTLLMAQILT
jgi:hypothetical protein